MIPLSLVNGFFYPKVTISLLAVYYVGRYFYTVGYQENEGAMDKTRIAGSVLVNSAKIATFGVFMWVAV